MAMPAIPLRRSPSRPGGSCLTRRAVSGSAASIALGVLAAACAPGATQKPGVESAQPAEIEYIHGFGDALANPIAEQFTQRFPHLTVRAVNMPWKS